MTGDLYLVTSVSLETETDTVRNESWQVERKRVQVVEESTLPLVARRCLRWIDVRKIAQLQDHAVGEEAEKLRQSLVASRDKAEARNMARLRMKRAEAELARAKADLEEVEARAKGQIP